MEAITLNNLSSNILRQTKSITEFDPEVLQAKQMHWINMYMAREKFLEALVKALTADKVKGKARSKAYSDAVVKYDKENGQNGWGGV